MKKLLSLILLFSWFSMGSVQLSKSQEPEFCRILKQMIEASRENFEPIKMDRKNGMIELYYTSKVSLPTSADTKIILGGESWYLSCKMQENKDKVQLEKEYMQLSNVVRNCLKTWRQYTPENIATSSKAVAFKETVDAQCGPTLMLSMIENPAKFGYYKIMITIRVN